MLGINLSCAKDIGRTLVYTFCSAHVITKYAVDVTLTQGPSMVPTIDESRAIAFFVRPHLLRILRGSPVPIYRDGDIVIAKSPTNATRRICKRVVVISPEHRGDIMVPEGHVWLEGDNKSNSLDSRYYGAVSSHLLLGRVFLVISQSTGVSVL
ncbi:Signal peptidase peptidase S26 family protein [Babesia bovis T2Bo]|uniref:Peptidase S26 domain-containing protein n=1 Tax=Babesia bovis TaxID=5865 RepID=A7AWS9_BABBO|nr:Signal peptidase peptidase S26 family protein [Babesia bovis T2Bo]EDO05507.1 Signal peptidase peptidase S26 family protein [Babesia bovis T2Bo]|eukprot:XP_001609075.1 hypothetical protein [Babesia bovis T2Bo]